MQTDIYETNTFQCTTKNGFYLIRLLVVGVTDAVGEDESDSCGEVVPIAMRDAGDAPSGALISRLISSLLLRETKWENAPIFIICKHETSQTHSYSLTNISSETMHGNPYTILRFSVFLDTFHLGSIRDLDCTTNIYDQACILKQRKCDEYILMEYRYFHLKDFMMRRNFNIKPFNFSLVHVVMLLSFK